VVAGSVREELEAELRRQVSDAGPLGLELAGLDHRGRALLSTLDGIAVAGGRATVEGTADPLADHPYLAALAASPFTPPAPMDEGVDERELRELVRRGLVIEQDGVYFAPTAIDDAAGLVAGLLADHPDGVTVSEVRDRVGTTRKYVLPLLGRLDAAGVTRRRGDVRVGGPRLPAPRYVDAD
jgi:selenocysteine-specific elongation factor